MTTSFNRLILAICVVSASVTLAQQPTVRADLIGENAVPVLTDGTRPFGACQDASGKVLADGARYRAEFDVGGARFETPAPAADGILPRLELRYLGSRRSGATAPADQAAEAGLTRHLVRYRHGNVTETYEIQANGYEQSFQIAQRPAGSGDLVLEIAVGGNVQAPARQLGHHALEFSYGEHRAIRYGEAFAFGRGGDRIDVETRYDGQSRIELIVPASFVDTATYPIVVDPIVTPVFLPGDPTWNDVEPEVAYDINTEHYMVVWQRIFSAVNSGIRGRIYDREGVPVTGEIFLTSGGYHETPAVALNNQVTGDAFLVVWKQGDTIQGQLRSVSDGSPGGTQFAVSSPAAGESDARPTVSGPGFGVIMVAWQRTTPGDTNPSQIVLRKLYWINSAQPNWVNIDPEEVLDDFGGTTSYVGDVKLADSDVRVEVSGQSWYANRAVWHRFYSAPAPGDFDLRTASFRFRSNQTGFAFIDSAGPVPGGANIGTNEQLPDIGVRAALHHSAADVQYLIAWEEEGDVFGQMFDLDVSTAPGITIRATPVYEGQPAIGAGFCEFTVAYLEIIPPAEFDVQVRAARVLLDGSVPIDDRLVDDPGSVFQTSTAASSRPVHNLAEKESNRTLLTWSGATGSGTGANDVRAAFFEPVGASLSFFGSACPGPLGELPSIGTTGGLPHAGNEDFAFTVDDAPAQSLAVLVVSDVFTTTPIPGAPGCFLYAGLPLINIFPTVTDAAGFGTVPLVMPCSIPSGASLAFQWAIYSPSANAFGWIVSDDIDVNWNH